MRFIQIGYQRRLRFSLSPPWGEACSRWVQQDQTDFVSRYQGLWPDRPDIVKGLEVVVKPVVPLTVYRIRTLDERFQRIVPDDLAAFRARFPRAFSGASLEPMGPDPIRCHVDDSAKPAADFGGFLPGSFSFSDAAAAASRTNMLSQVLWGNCELLTLDVAGKLHYAVNARISNCFDRRAANFETLPDGRVVRIRRYAFHRDRMSWNVFEIPETAGDEIFTYTGSAEGLASDPDSPRLDDDFVLGLREEGYSGMELEAVWAAPDPGEAIWGRRTHARGQTGSRVPAYREEG